MSFARSSKEWMSGTLYRRDHVEAAFKKTPQLLAVLGTRELGAHADNGKGGGGGLSRRGSHSGGSVVDELLRDGETE